MAGLALRPEHPGAGAFELRPVQWPQGLPAPLSSWLLPAGGLTIGRAPDCGLVLPDPLRLVSRQQARIDWQDGTPQVRCLSARTPLWVNGGVVAEGESRPLLSGDRLRIGGFEWVLAEVARTGSPPPAVVSPAEQRPVGPPLRRRLDDWFDLDTVADPLGLGTPPAEAAVTPPWTPQPAPTHPPLQPSSPQPSQPPIPSPNVTQAAPDRPGATAEPVAPEVLLEAFLRGAGLDPAKSTCQLTPEWMEQLGELLRASTEGALALLQSRATVKDGMGMEGTRIAQVQNNPLKFAPDAQAALLHLLGRRPLRGYMAPVPALRDTFRDLLVHHLAVMAGMRAAVFELFDRLGPEALMQERGDPPPWERLLPALHDAALWRRHLQRHLTLRQHLDDDFETVFGRQFKRAYEAQSRGAKPSPPAASAD